MHAQALKVGPVGVYYGRDCISIKLVVAEENVSQLRTASAYLQQQQGINKATCEADVSQTGQRIKKATNDFCLQMGYTIQLQICQHGP